MNLGGEYVEVEISGEEPDVIRKEALETVWFLNEHQDEFGGFPNTSSAADIEPHPQQASEGNPESTDEQPSNARDEKTPDEPNPFTRLAKEVNADQEVIEKYFILDTEIPVLYIPDIQLLGDTREERQRRAALILLYLWEICLGEDCVKSSILKDALVQSGIDDSTLTNAYRGDADRYFERNGRGRSATVGLTGPGSREGYKEIKQLLELVREPKEEEPPQWEDDQIDKQERMDSREEESEETKETNDQSASLMDYE